MMILMTFLKKKIENLVKNRHVFFSLFIKIALQATILWGKFRPQNCSILRSLGERALFMNRSAGSQKP